jgi:cell division protein FtsQ
MYPPISSNEELRQRRFQLRKQRRLRAIKVCWQVLVLGALVGGIGWAVRQPDWVIRRSQQIQVSGNRYLSANAVREMLDLKYPVSLLQIEPQSLNKKLLGQGNIAAATIYRELIPPRITIQVQDQAPVAMADRAARSGLVNAAGNWLPLASYQITADQLPRLQLLSANSGLCPDWPALYRAVQQSPVTISEIDCRNPLNLLLKTEIGNLRIGAFEQARFYKQLQKAHEMREWQQQYQLKFHQISDVAYIDIENPDVPKIQYVPKIKQSAATLGAEDTNTVVP